MTNVAGGATKLPFHEFVAKFGADIAGYVDSTADAVGRSASEAVVTDEHELALLSKFEADVGARLRSTAPTSPGGGS